MWEWEKRRADRRTVRIAGIKGGGVLSNTLTWFVSRTHILWDPSLDPANARVCVSRGGARTQREGVLVSVVRSQRWLMVYRRTLMGDSSSPAAVVYVATWVTCNLSPGSQATSPQLCGMRRIDSPDFSPSGISLHLSELWSYTQSLRRHAVLNVWWFAFL